MNLAHTSVLGNRGQKIKYQPDSCDDVSLVLGYKSHDCPTVHCFKVELDLSHTVPDVAIQILFLSFFFCEGHQGTTMFNCRLATSTPILGPQDATPSQPVSFHEMLTDVSGL